MESEAQNFSSPSRSKYPPPVQPPSSFHFLPVNANRAPLIASPMQSLSFQTDVFGGRGAMIYYRGHSDSFAQAPAVNCDGGSTYPGQHVLVDRRRFYGIYSLELAMRASACSRGCARITSFSDISKETHPARFPSWGAFKSLYRLPRCLFIKPPHRRRLGIHLANTFGGHVSRGGCLRVASRGE